MTDFSIKKINKKAGIQVVVYNKSYIFAFEIRKQTNNNKNIQ